MTNPYPYFVWAGVGLSMALTLAAISFAYNDHRFLAGGAIIAACFCGLATIDIIDQNKSGGL